MNHGHNHSLTPSQLAARHPVLGAAGRRLAVVAGAVGLIALAASWFLGAGQDSGMRHFYFAYLTAYCFWLSLALGALFYLIIHFLIRDGSLVVIRRIAEHIAGTIPLLAVLILPIIIPMLAGSSELYRWLDTAVRTTDTLVQHKAAYLNLGFLVIRLAAYFATWCALAWFFRGQSLRQDSTGAPQITLRLWRTSAPAMLLFALSVTFFAVDMIMTLDPHWFSTIFGVYFFAGCMVGAYAALVLATVMVQRAGHLRRAVNAEHFHDLGKLLFAFLFFWGYIAFSQYMLYWYGNIPEETGWYLRRFDGGWLWFSVALLLAILLNRFVKRRRRLLAVMAVWMLAAHWIDLYWLIMPEYSAGVVPLSLLDLTCFTGIGALAVAGFGWLAGNHALAPLKDPNLAESLRFENV